MDPKDSPEWADWIESTYRSARVSTERELFVKNPGAPADPVPFSNKYNLCAPAGVSAWEKAGVSFVNSAVNELLTRFLFPRALHCEVFINFKKLVGGRDALSGFVYGLAAGCRANGMVLGREFTVRETDGDALAASASVSGARAGEYFPCAASAGDAVIGVGGLELTKDAELTFGDSAVYYEKSYYGELLSPIRRGAIRNLARVGGGAVAPAARPALGRNVAIEWDLNHWTESEFSINLRKTRGLSRMDSFDRWNAGIGMLVIVDRENEKAILDELAAWNELRWLVGRVSGGG